MKNVILSYFAAVLFFSTVACAPEHPVTPNAHNVAPSMPTIVISPANPTTDQDLKVIFVDESVDPEGSTVSYLYRWLKNSVIQPDMVTDTVPSASTGKGEQWQVFVRATDGKAESDAATSETTIVNSRPVVTVTIDPAMPTTVDDLVARPVGLDSDNDTVAFRYAWTKSGTQQSTIADRVAASSTARGDIWQVTVVPNDGEVDGTAASATVTVQDALPVLTEVTVGPSPAYVTTTIVSMLGTASDDDGDTVTFAYEWKANGTTILGQSGATLPPGNCQKGDSITVTVTPNDGAQDGPAVTSTALVVSNSAPAITGVHIDPNAGGEAATFTCIPDNFSDADNDAAQYVYQWRVNGTATVTTATITGQNFSRGDAITCTAIPTDGVAQGTARTSTGVTIANTAPSIASVTITPSSPRKGDTIAAEIVGWTDVDGDTSGYIYAWKVNGIQVAATATLSSSFNKNNTIQLEVTPWDGQAAGTTVYSNVVTAVNTAPAIAGVSITPLVAYTNSNLAANDQGVVDVDGEVVTVHHQWYVNDSLAGSDSSVLSGTFFAKTDVVYVTAQPADSTVRGNTVASESVTIVNSAPTTPVAVIVPASPTVSDNLVCQISTYSTDADTDSLTYSFSWKRNGVDFANATTTSHTGDTVPSSNLVRGEIWRCELTANDGIAFSPTAISEIQIENDFQPPTGYNLNFNASNSIVVIPNSASLNPTTSMTIEFWSYLNDSSRIQYYVLKDDFSNRQFSLACEGISGAGKVRVRSAIRTTSRFNYVDVDTDIVQQSWAHIAMTYDGNVLRLFVNGAFVQQWVIGEPIVTTTADLTFGDNTENYALGGRLDEIRFWSVARSETEIHDNMRRVLVGNEIGLLGYWRLDEGVGDVVADLTGRNHGRLGSAIGVDAADPTWGSSGAPSCGAGAYRNENSKCYILQTSAVTWSAAETSCVSRGGHLASIESEAEAIFVETVFGYVGNKWIGLRNNVATWTDGTSLVFTRWNGGEPNGTPGLCVQTLTGFHGAWNDIECSTILADGNGFRTHAFVCEKMP